MSGSRAIAELRYHVEPPTARLTHTLDLAAELLGHRRYWLIDVGILDMLAGRERLRVTNPGRIAAWLAERRAALRLGDDRAARTGA